MGIIMYKVINDKKEFYGTIHYTKIAVIWFLHVLLFFMPQSFAENDEQNERARYIQERQIIELSKGTPKNIKQEKEERNQQQFSKTTSVYIKKILWLNGEEPPTSVKNILKTYENKKNSGKDLQELLKTINQKIQQEGYITTKVILEPQHIQNGVIYLILQKGMIRDFIYEKESARIQTTRIFPEGKGGWLNLRDLEQGVENIQNVPGETVQMKIIPRKDNSGDILLDVTKGKNWQIHENVEYTGKIPYTNRWRIEWGNPLHLQDVVTLQMGENIGHDAKYKEYKHVSIVYGLPYKKYYFSFRTSYLTNGQPLPIGALSYPYRTKTKENVYKIEKLIQRDRHKKEKCFLAYHTYERRNTIGNTELKVQHIHKSDISAGLTYDRYFTKGQFHGLYSFTKNLEEYNEETEKKKYIIHRFDLSYVRYFLKKYQYQGLFHGQIGTGTMYDADEISIGGLYTVRGYTGRNTYSGKSGWYIQNEYQKRNEKSTYYIAWDIGNIKIKNKSLWLSGIAVGIRGNNKIFYDASIAMPLVNPKNWKNDKVVAYANIGFGV